MKKPVKAPLLKEFRKTTVKGLYLTKNGKAYNQTTGNELKPVRGGRFTLNGKQYNLAKLILETFKKTPVRGGQIFFINGNNQDFNFNNLDYTSKGITHTAPTEKTIIKVIRLYFEVEKNFNSQSLFYKSHLKSIVLKRSFVNSYDFKELILFIEWLGIFSNSKAQISKNNGLSIRNGTNLINKYLLILVNECLLDYENGLLKESEFLPKPPTKTEILIKANATLKSYGSNIQIKLRKTNKNNFKGL